MLITGGEGFIGSHLKKYFNASTYDLKNKQDILDRDALENAIIGQDYVLHLAGMLGTHELVDDVENAVKINILGTINVLDMCAKHKVRVLVASKPNVWKNTYSITKECVENFVEMYRREHGLEAVITKWFNVYGPGQPLEEEIGYKKAVPTWIVDTIRGKKIEIYGDGEQTMDLIHTDDICSSVDAILKNWEKCEGKTFEIGKDEITCNDLAKMIGAEINHIPMRKGETPATRLKADTSLITELTGWKPIKGLEEGLKETIKWYENKYSNIHV
jgi:UDP-glucose 4-epimerase